MPDVMSVRVDGLRELQAKMQALGPKIATKALRSALVSGARVIKQDAIQRAPVKSGTLRKAILVKILKYNPFSLNVIVGVRHGRMAWRKGKDGKFDKSRDAYYWGFLEFGHKNRSGKDVPAKHFLVPAFETKKFAALERIKTVLSDKIAKLVRESA